MQTTTDQPEVAGITPYPFPERFGSNRRTILRQTGKKDHRYRKFRGLTQVVSLVILALVPLLHVARVDLLGSDHYAWLESADLFHGLIAVGVAIFAFYFFTFQINLVGGRLFCGFGCPIGQLNRLTDTFLAQNKKPGRLRWGLILGAFALALSASVGIWWTAPEAFIDHRAPFVWGALALMTGAAVAFARIFGWSFCRKACPIGLYYSVVQQRRPIGILFDRSLCQDEGACVRACPVELDPRNLGEEKRGIGGFAIDGLAQNNHCLRCGACVEACELVTSKQGAPALVFGRPDAPLKGTGDLVQIGEMRLPESPVERRAVAEPIAIAAPSSEPTEDPTKSRTAVALMATIAIAIVGGAIAFAILREPKATKPVDDTPPPVAVVDEPKGPNATFGALEGRVTKNGAPVPNVTIAAAATSSAAKQRRKIFVSVKDAAYDRAIYVALPKDRIRATNHDSALHTFHISGADKTVRNVPLPSGRSAPAFAAPRPGTYRLYCDAHPSEKAALVVLEESQLVVTDDDGRFRFEKLPAGSRKLRAFAADGTELTRDVEIVADGTAQQRLELN